MTRYNERFLVVINQELREQLDGEAVRQSDRQGRTVSRSELVRQALRAFLKPADALPAVPVRPRTRPSV